MKKKIDSMSRFFPYILGILIIAFVLIQKFSQNDLYFDIRTGKDILKYGIDFKDHFSFIPGLKYLYHHWFYDLIIYFIYTKFSYVGVFIFFYSLYVLFGLILFKTNYKADKNKFLSFIVSIITLYLTKDFFGTRVQSISYIIFFLEIIFINKLYNTGEIKYSIILILMSILLVNIHMPVWILYLIFFLPFIAEMLFSKFSKLYNKNITNKLIFCNPKNSKIFLITFIVVILTGLISPYKFMPYIFFIKTLGNPYYSYIGEMQKTILINSIPFLIIVFCSIITLIFCKVKARDFFLIFGLLLLALFANRHRSYFCTIIPTLIYKIIVENDFKIIKLKLSNFKVNTTLISFVLTLLPIILYVMCFITLNFKKFNYHENENYPNETIKYIKKYIDKKNLRIYNNFNIGSYLAFNDVPDFVDSRAEVFMANFNNSKDILEDIFINIKNYEDYEKIIKKYNFNYILVEKNEILNSYIKDKEEYQLLYNEKNEYFLYSVNLK